MPKIAYGLGPGHVKNRFLSDTAAKNWLLTVWGRDELPANFA